MAERLTDDPGLQLLQNTAATAGVLVALILALGPASGAHFNPAVTLVDRVFGGIDTPTAAAYVVVQVGGAIVGAIVANVMFDLPAVEWSTTARAEGNLWFAEGIATLGLLLVIFGVVRSGRSTVAAFAVAGYIAGAYYFTSSTSFANPAVTIGRRVQQHLRWDRTRLGPGLHRRPADRRGSRRAVDPRDLPERHRGGGRRRGSPRHHRAPPPGLGRIVSRQEPVGRHPRPRRAQHAPLRSPRDGAGTTPTCPAARDRSDRLAPAA